MPVVIDQLPPNFNPNPIRGAGGQGAQNQMNNVSMPPVRGGGQPMGARMKKGGVVSASKRADGIAQRGKTRGKMC